MSENLQIIKDYINNKNLIEGVKDSMPNLYRKYKRGGEAYILTRIEHLLLNDDMPSIEHCFPHIEVELNEV